MEPAVVLTVVLAVLRELPQVVQALSVNDFMETAVAIADAISRIVSGEAVSDVLDKPLRRAESPDLDALRESLVRGLGFMVEGNATTIPPTRNS